MRIYLDESKRLWEWKIVFGWFITKHSYSYIQKELENKKIEYKIKSKVELKWKDNLWKYFYKRFSNDWKFNLINNSIIWINISNYYKDSLKWYKKIIYMLLNQNINYFINYNKDIIVIADYVNFWKKTKIEKEIEKYLNDNFEIKSRIKFNFWLSDNVLWIQLADIISYKLWKSFFFWEILDDYINENLFNIDIQKVFKA